MTPFMRQILSHLILLCLSVTSALCFAKEPINLAIVKQQVQQYHDSGEYEHDIARVMMDASRYLAYRLNHPRFHGKPAVILDIDETALSNYPNMVKLSFGGTLDEIRQGEMQGKDSVIAPTLKFYRYAKSRGIAVFFISGRLEMERAVTQSNLENAGYTQFDGLILRNEAEAKAHAADYKMAKRKQLEAQGFDIILNIGDQKSDLRGGHADKTYKLPNPYYLIP